MKIYQVDSFTQDRFKGNPAAVALVESPLSEVFMQQVAAEMNLSETAFVERQGKANEFGLRWLTPSAEVDLCGHATLATAHILWQIGWVPGGQEITFNTRSGPLHCRQEADGSIMMDFPRVACEPLEVSDAHQYMFRGKVVAAHTTAKNLLLELDSAETVRLVSPNMGEVSKNSKQGIIITAASDKEGVDFISRYFAPNVGVAEDPVTGSIHCILAPYWAEKLGKESFTAYQASRRGGELRLTLRGERVDIRGHAVTVFETDI